MEKRLVAVRQFDGSVELLKIDIMSGEREIIPFSAVEKNRVAFGFFEIEKNEAELDTVALVATPDGPLFFLKDLKYFPEIKKTKIKINQDGDFFHFQILHEGHHVFGLFYEEKFGIGLHPFIHTREDFDFYYWLRTIIDNPEFYQKYTREIRYYK
jgi:hypothetical protein